MLDVLLINPFDVSQLRGRLGLKAPPLNLMYLASTLEKASRKVMIIDNNLYEMAIEKLAKIVSKLNPLVIGITAATATIKIALKYMDAIKRLIPNALFVIGGPHATFLPIETLKESNSLDAVVIGEGELTIVDLVEKFDKKGKEGLKEVKGIAYKNEKGNIKLTEPRGFIKDLDSIPFPARHLVQFEKYRLFGEKSPIGAMITSRGCTFNCGYCASSLLMGKIFRTRSPKNVVDEMEILCTKYKVKDIEFLDDTFTLNKKRALAIASEIEKRKLDVNYVISSRVDTIDRNLLFKLKKSGLTNIYYGIESGSQRVLNLMRKGISLKQAEHAIRISKEIGVNTLASFIIGYPGETLEEINSTINFAIKLNPDYAQFSILTPFPGTPIYYELKNKGLLATEDWEKYTVLEPVINYEKLGLSKKIIAKKLREAYMKFYLRPSYIFTHINMIKVLAMVFLRSYLLPRIMNFQRFLKFFTKKLILN